MTDASRTPWLRGIRAATTFLTRVPVGGFPYSDHEWRWASAFFPVVGLGLGLVAALQWWLVGAAVGDASWVPAVLVVGTGMLFTGGFHEDGLADAADALGGGYSRERVLEILKDSRIGAYGAMALFIVVLGRVATLASMPSSAPLALVVTQCLSRCPPVWLMVTLPYATDDARAKSRRLVAAGRRQALVATAWPTTLLLSAWAMGWISGGCAVELVFVCIAVTAACAVRFRRSVGGITGDFLGANQQLTELAALVVMLRWSGGA